MLCGTGVYLRQGDSVPLPEPRLGRTARGQSHPRTFRASDQKTGSTFLARLAAAEPRIRCSAFR
jgi:hypothetical protein